MPASNTCWGIEMGSGSVKALKLQRDGDELRVLEFAVIPHKKVLSTPDLDQAEATRVALGQLVSQYDLTGSTVAISVPGNSAFARFAKLPPVEPKKIPDIVKFEAVQQIPFPIDQVEWDYQTFTSPDNPDVEVGIFAITRDRIMERLAMWNDVGITPDYVTLGPIAVYNAVAWDQNFGPQTPGTVILDVGTTSTDLIVCEPGRVWVRTFQIGGHNFTEALVSAFKLGYSRAEALKHQAEQSKHARHVFQAMRPVFGDLAQEVQRSIGYYQTGHRDANLTRLIGLGSTFNLPGLRKYLSQQLQMEVVRLEQFNKISVDGPRAGEFQGATLNLATAYGLAIQALGFEHGIMANLMPVPVVREAMWRRKTKWFALAAGLSVAGGAMAFIRPVRDRVNVEGNSRTAAVEEVIGRLRTLKAEWKEVEDTFAPNLPAANYAGLVDAREIHAFLANDLGQMLAAARDHAEANPVGEGEKKAPVGFRFHQFTTSYDGTPAPDPAAGGDPMAGGMDPMAAGVRGGQRLDLTLEISTTRPDAERFLVDTIRKWLQENADRPGVPYTIDLSKVRHERTTARIGDENQPGGPGPGASAPGNPFGGGRERPPAGGNPFGNRGPGAASPGSGSPPPGQENIEALAPFPPAPAEAQPGQTLYTFKVYWQVVIRSAKPAEESNS